MFESVADHGPVTYRARAIQTLGTGQHYKGHLDEALRLQLEALSVASDKNAHGLLTTLLARLEIATIKSLNGDHNGALNTLESLPPLVQVVIRQNPLYFYFYHNELAVEFGEVGRIEEARAASKIALASPFAAAYPEWSETRQELEEKHTSATRSVVAFSRITEAEPSPQIQSQHQRVLANSPAPECEAKPEPSPLIAPQRQPEPPRALNLTWAAKTTRAACDNVSFQRPIIPIPAKATFAINAVSILDRVLNCIGPRAPPTCH